MSFFESLELMWHLILSAASIGVAGVVLLILYLLMIMSVFVLPAIVLGLMNRNRTRYGFSALSIAVAALISLHGMIFLYSNYDWDAPERVADSIVWLPEKDSDLR